MRVAILGGCGFVGRAFARHLASIGHDIVLVDDLSAGLHIDNWEPRLTGRYVFKHTDCRRYFRYTDPDSFDLIIHCAAVVGGRLKIDGDPLAIATNLGIDAEFFRWCVKGKKPKQVIYFSSSAAYPTELQTEAKHMLLNESLLNFYGTRISLPDQTYGWSKLSGEYLAKFAAEHYGLAVKIYRPFGGYGHDQDMNYPMPSIISRVLRRENPIVVWGSGNQCRDFVHIDDVVDCVMQTKDKLKPGEVLNIGTGRATSFRELAEMTCNILGHKADIVNDSTKPEGVYFRVADAYKLYSLGFRPKITLEEGIARVAEYLSSKVLDAAGNPV